LFAIKPLIYTHIITDSITLVDSGCRVVLAVNLRHTPPVFNGHHSLNNCMMFI